MAVRMKALDTRHMDRESGSDWHLAPWAEALLDLGRLAWRWLADSPEHVALCLSVPFAALLLVLAAGGAEMLGGVGR